MKIFKFSIIESELVVWSFDTARMEDLLYTGYDKTIQSAFDRSLQFKKFMGESRNDAVSDISIFKLKQDLAKIIAKDKFYGLKYEEDTNQITFTIFEANIQNEETTKLYRRQVQQYSDFFHKNLTDNDIQRIHPSPTMIENITSGSFIQQMNIHEKDMHHITYFEINHQQVCAVFNPNSLNNLFFFKKVIRFLE